MAFAGKTEGATAGFILRTLDHKTSAFLPGLTADARILVDRARLECQNHKLTVEDPVTLEYITRFIATVKQVWSL